MTQAAPLRSLPILLAALLALALLAGCGPQPTVKPDQPTQAEDNRVAEAEAAFAAQQWPAAAALYESLGATDDPAGWGYRLRAIQAWLNANQTQRAAELLASLPALGLDTDQQLEKRLLQAELALKQAQLEQALGLLQQPPAADARADLQQRYYQDLADAYRLAGNLLESANALQRLDALLIDLPEQRLANQLAIVRTLSVLTDQALQQLQPSPPGISGGWMALARLIKLHADQPDQLRPLIDQWRTEHPQHPALPELLEGYFAAIEQQFQKASHIAVLLPESGRYRHAAKAIRDGLTAAWFRRPAADRPTLRFYNSSNPDQLWPLYSEAVERGADFVIGPLQKPAVAQLANAGELPVPVLALNEVEDTGKPPQNLYQYSLSPEDEARQAAERIWLDGHRHPLLLTTDNSWGQRIADAFRKRWLSLGGEITEWQVYDAKAYDFGAPIQALLDLDQSKQRRKSIQNLIGQRLEFEPRRRADADAIFVAARANQARLLRPQLQFHHAADLPVYSTSHAWSGHIDLDKDRDLNGLLFPDMPWLLADEGDTPLSASRLDRQLGIGKSRYIRLYAMGIDAMQMLGHLNRLKGDPLETLDGKSGQLYMDGFGHLHRQLVWARIKDSRPEVIGYAPRLLQASSAPFENAPVEETTAATVEQGSDSPAPGNVPAPVESRTAPAQ